MGVFEDVEADLGHLLHPFQSHRKPLPTGIAARAAAARAQQSQPSQPEEPTMDIREELIHMLQSADADALHAVNIVLAHPEGITVVSDVAALAGLNVPPGTITQAATGLKAVLGLFGQQLAGQQQAPQQPVPPAKASFTPADQGAPKPPAVV